MKLELHEQFLVALWRNHPSALVRSAALHGYMERILQTGQEDFENSIRVMDDLRDAQTLARELGWQDRSY